MRIRVRWFWLFSSLALIGLLVLAPGSSAVQTQGSGTSGGPGPLPPGDAAGGPHSAQRLASLQQQYLLRESDASGQVRPDLYAEGVADQQAMATSAAGAVANVVNPHAGITGTQWTQIGPDPLRIDAQQIFQGAGPDSGEVVDIAVDPSGSSDSTIYIATNDGGIWKSTDAGAHWTPKTDYMPSLSMGAVLLDPSNPSIVYAGTGNNFDGGGIFSKGVGIYRSMDGGDTWTVLNPGGIFTNKAIVRMVMPASGTLLVATPNGLYKSVDGGASFGNNAPSFNNGASILGGYITDLHIDTASASTVYAAVNGSGLFRSTDTGTTFPTNIFDTTVTTNLSGFISFSQSTSPNNATMYANVVVSGQSTPAEIFRTTDATATNPTWAQVAAGSAESADPAAGNCQCGYDQTIGIDPANANTIYIGYQKEYASTDGGASFNQVSDNKIHWDEHSITFSPHAGNPRRVYVGNDGGIATSTNDGGTWTSIDETLATNLYFSFDIGRGSAANDAYSYGGTQDTGINDHRPGDTGTDWHLGIDGDGGSTVVSRQDPTVAYSTDDGCFERTTNGGTNWSSFAAASSGLPACSFGAPDGALGLLAVDPNNQENLFGANGTKLFRATNAKSGSPVTFTEIDGGGGFPANIVAFGATAADSNTLWVGLGNGTLEHSTNALAATPTWTQVTVTGSPGTSIGGLTVDPTSTATVVVTYEGFNATGPSAGVPDKRVFMTTNTGGVWTDISGTDGVPGDILPNLPTHSVVIDTGTTPHQIIVSNDAGVLRTLDGGASWQVLGFGLPTVRASQLQIDTSQTPSVLRVATYGRSVFQLTAPTGPIMAVTGSLSFGNVGVGHTATQTVNIANKGSSDLHVASITETSGGADFALAAPFSATTIPAGTSINVSFTFTPSATGSQSATFKIESDDQFQPHFQLNASGTGVKNNTTTVVMSDHDPSVYGQPVTFTATVSDVAGAGAIAPTGTVTFFDGATMLGSASLDGMNPGHAVLLPPISSFTVGDHFIHAVYAGDINFNGSTSANLDQTVNKAPTTTTVTTSGSPSDFGSAVTFTAHVVPAPPSTMPAMLPTGTVKFLIDGTLFTTKTLVQSTGRASFSTHNLLPGTHVIEAVYSGDGNFLSSSGTVMQTVTCMINVTGSIPGAIAVGAGSTCIVNATVGGAVYTTTSGAKLFIGNSTIGGTVQTAGATLVGICSSHLGGSTIIRNSTGFVVMGDADDACGGNTVLRGTVQMTGNRGDVELSNNHLPSLNLTGTTGKGPFPDDTRAEVESNVIAGSVVCLSNTPSPTNDGHPNTVTGARTGQCAGI